MSTQQVCNVICSQSWRLCDWGARSCSDERKGRGVDLLVKRSYRQCPHFKGRQHSATQATFQVMFNALMHPTTIIICDLSNNEFDTLWLSGGNSHTNHSDMTKGTSPESWTPRLGNRVYSRLPNVTTKRKEPHACTIGWNIDSNKPHASPGLYSSNAFIVIKASPNPLQNHSAE